MSFDKRLIQQFIVYISNIIIIIRAIVIIITW